MMDQLARRWSGIRVGVALAVAAAVALAIGVPSALLVNPFHMRMTAVPWWSCTAWAATSVLSGVIVSTYVHAPPAATGTLGRVGIAATIGSALAVGSPACNRPVMAVLGRRGALRIWAPMQPVLAATSPTVLGRALRHRLSTLRSWPTETPSASMTVARHEPLALQH